jgi:hypothetical protein
MLYGFDQPGCDIARAFLEVQYHTPTIGSAPHESGTDGSNADLDKSYAGVGIIQLRLAAGALIRSLSTIEMDC